MKKDYMVLLIQLDRNLASDVPTFRPDALVVLRENDSYMHL